MITVNLTEYEYRILRSALETEYYHAKDAMDDSRMDGIASLETKLGKAKEETE